MRVLLANDNRAHGGSGAEVHVGVLADALRAAGATVELFCGEVTHHGVQRALDVWDPRARRLLRARAAAFDPDVVHHHNVLRELSVAVVGVPRQAACVVSVHDVRLLTGVDGERSRGLAAGAKRVKAAIDRTVVRRRADVVVAHSEAMAIALRAAGYPRVRQLAAFAAEPDASVLRPPSSGHELLYAGRLAPEKGVAVLLDAFRRVRDARPAARLAIAGDGPALDDLRRVAGSDGGVVFLGRLDASALQRRMGTARAVVVPSLAPEGGPVVAVEAALAGRPIVVTDVPGAPDVVRRSGGGRVVPAGDVHALEVALAAVLDDAAAADAMGAAGRTHALARHTPARAAAAMLDVYREAVTAAHRRLALRR